MEVWIWVKMELVTQVIGILWNFIKIEELCINSLNIGSCGVRKEFETNCTLRLDQLM
jgi:hypothetical protein